MIDVAIVVEGQTEQAFVTQYLQPHFASLGINIWPTLPGRIFKRGGAKAWEAIRRDILRLLKQRSGRICTTMFDFYALPPDWPGRKDAGLLPLADRADCIEKSLRADVCNAMGSGFRQEYFLPYIQMHEFEALLFSGVGELAELLSTISCRPPSGLATQLEEMVNEAGGPEAINDHPDSAPSKRICSLASGYRKAIHGPIVAGKIGLARLRIACPHFGAWLSNLEKSGDYGS